MKKSVWHNIASNARGHVFRKSFKQVQNLIKFLRDLISHYKKIGYIINVLQQTACLVVNPNTIDNLVSPLIARKRVVLQTLWRFRLKIYLSNHEMVEASCIGCCKARQYLPVGILLLRYSVLFTVESLSLLYLLLIY